MYSYQQLLQWIQQQNAQLQELEKTVKALQKQVEELKEQPRIAVEKIEYKFDQLKVENLDGTLNIGLNPGDAKSIEELAVNQAGNPLQSIPVDQLREPLIKDMQDFLANHLDSIIQDNETQLQRSLDAPYYTHIKEDLLKQIPERVNFYLETFPVGALEQNNPDGAFNKILSKLKNDVQQAIFTFISQMPDQKGEDADDSSGSE
ncbi:hypothetical protein Q73_03815 [Bacillus coahuilensis m2-6]|uniref:spore germination protein GerPC n=1 Tax=Bacillus coahuilensis TaxID=408580 RepID=UPI0007505DA7|nr:spore germination protein GerPC [Bacillus coahuilensis]KUP09040.1 hypothetical protein Q73_03815 [Bacillus coahuilensis m2-6]